MAKRYESDKELLKAIDKRVHDYLDPYIYQGVAYDEKDEEDFWNLLRSKEITAIQPRIGKKKQKNRRVPQFKSSDSEEWTKLYSGIATRTREALGLNKPIGQWLIMSFLSNLKNKKEQENKGNVVRPLSISYPKNDILCGPEEVESPFKGLHIWVIGQILIPGNIYVVENGEKIPINDIINHVSNGFNCHPALALSYLLCDTPVFNDLINIIIGARASYMSMYVREPRVSTYLVSKMYKLARQVFVSIRRNKEVKIPRPRANSNKVSLLGDFINTYKNLDWKTIWRKWNSRYPHWSYRNVNTMRVVFYRTYRSVDKRYQRSGIWSLNKEKYRRKQ